MTEPAKQIVSDNEALEMVKDDSIFLLTKEPFYAYLLVKMQKRIDRKVPVAGVSVVDGDLRLAINPDGFLAYTRPERIAILKHEVLHIIMIHYLRKRGRDHSLFNVAADIAINQMIDAPHCQLPTDCLRPEHYNLPKGESAEVYYKMLWERNEQIEIPQDLMQGPLGQQLQGQGNGEGENEGNGNLRAPSFAGLHPTWDESTDVSEQLAEGIIKSLVSDAYQKARGNVPGSIAQLVKEILQSKVNWRAILRNFVAKRRQTTRKSTWKRPNRRLGEDSPGYRKNKKLNIAIFVDTSGSVSDKELAMFNGEMQKIYQAGADILVIECDADIQKVYKYSKHLTPEFRGRGGTDFRPPFKYLQENKITPDLICYLTDGYGPAPSKCHIPTMWVLTPEGRRPYAEGGGEVKWGSHLTLKD